jgi:hypothetical protein
MPPHSGRDARQIELAQKTGPLIRRKAQARRSRKSCAMLPILAAAALAAAAPVPTYGFFDGESLVAACTATGPTAVAQQALCFGYVSGAVDMVLTQQALTRLDGRTVCPPTGLRLQTALQAVLERAAWAARARGVGAASFVKAALEDAYPCRPDQDVM